MTDSRSTTLRLCDSSTSTDTLPRSKRSCSTCLLIRFHKLCDAIGLAELKTDPRFSTNDQRVQNRSELIDIISACLKSQPSSVWLSKLSDCGLPSSKVNTVREAFEEDQSHARGMIQEIRCQMSCCGTIKLIGSFFSLSFIHSPFLDSRLSHRLIGFENQLLIRNSNQVIRNSWSDPAQSTRVRTTHK